MMNNIQNKNYLVIRNVCSNKHLRSYLEQICQDEKVSIVEQYVDSYTWLKPEPTLYDKLGAKPSFDIVIESYSMEKLRYIEYLYNIYEKQYRYSGNFVTNLLSNKKEYVEITQTPLTSYAQWNKDICDSMTYMSIAQENITKNNSGWAPDIRGIVAGAIAMASYFNKNEEKYRGPNGRIITLNKNNSDTFKTFVRENYERISNIQKQSKLHILKQKIKEYWNEYKYPILALIYGFLLASMIFILIILTITNNVVK